MFTNTPKRSAGRGRTPAAIGAAALGLAVAAYVTGRAATRRRGILPEASLLAPDGTESNVVR